MPLVELYISKYYGRCCERFELPNACKSPELILVLDACISCKRRHLKSCAVTFASCIYICPISVDRFNDLNIPVQSGLLESISIWATDGVHICTFLKQYLHYLEPASRNCREESSAMYNTRLFNLRILMEKEPDGRSMTLSCSNLKGANTRKTFGVDCRTFFQ